MTTRDEIQEHALGYILETCPRLVREIEQLNEDVFFPMSRFQYRRLRLEEALEEEAKRHRMHVWDYQLKLAEQSGIDISAIREEDRCATAAALGLDDFTVKSS
ncbi:DUF6388 family protein [Pseudomonas fluorescens]|jgi:hypothetical protein|uniref:DUF6388 family protein n=1 Tax=Pseudomonas fluorescens TaxID=294 RepID=UPI0035938484